MVMKLKQNARGLDPSKSEKQVPMKERRFFFARAGSEGDSRPFWLPSTCSCGKALDLMATALKVPNKNNLPTTPDPERLVLVSSTASSVILQSAKSIGETIVDGDEVWLLKKSSLEP
ncbi:hypothetical protein P389DRAFT_38683 [Cystobasidium minutum MCA 4210]|uniref:uncharacterized protein n=1 Tax=Cystobasidium minutum MCA 4210 TaxID=1397322 RepID=UPI0034CF7BE1|eukprot:jgi/Rhomi1/38683/CE38682_374